MLDILQDNGELVPAFDNNRISTDIAHEDIQRMVAGKRAGSPASVATPTSSIVVEDIQLPVKQVLVVHID